MTSDELKATVVEMAQTIGKQKTMRLLVVEGVSFSVAEKMAGGRYRSNIRSRLMVRAILRALQASASQPTA